MPFLAGMEKKSKKAPDAEQVSIYMDQLDHPLKEVVNALRKIILDGGLGLKERIKWNAPSYYTGIDWLTFNLRPGKPVIIVFHSEPIVHIKSDLLKGDYKDRRLMYFENMLQVEEGRAELERILKAYVK